jgi:hypothetical protein
MKIPLWARCNINRTGGFICSPVLGRLKVAEYKSIKRFLFKKTRCSLRSHISIFSLASRYNSQTYFTPYVSFQISRRSSIWPLMSSVNQFCTCLTENSGSTFKNPHSRHLTPVRASEAMAVAPAASETRSKGIYPC